MNRCKTCPFDNPQLFVPPKGNPQAKVVLIGEAPGKQELYYNKPFVGPSGKLLQKTANEVGLDIDESNVYVTNALKCYPLLNSQAVVPKKQHIQCCREQLCKELSQAPRDLIITMGNSALHAVTQNYNLKITKARGKVIDTEYGLVLPTFHPAAILRNSYNFPSFKSDLEYAARIINEGESAIKSLGNTKYTIVNEYNFYDVVNELLDVMVLSCDIETTGYNHERDRILSIGFCTAPNEVYIFDERTFDWLISTKFGSETFLEYLFNPTKSDKSFIFHNAKFDTKFINKRFGVNDIVYHDTMLLSYCLDERTGIHGLKDLSAKYLGADDYAKDIKPYINSDGTGFDKIPKDIYYQYLASDCDATLQLFHLFYPKVMKDKYLANLYTQILIPASYTLGDIEQNGIYVNLETLDNIRNELSVEIDSKLEELEYLAEKLGWNNELYAAHNKTLTIPKKFNPNSPAQVSWLLFNRNSKIFPIPPGYTKSTNIKILDKLPQVPFITTLKDYRKLRKLYTTYVMPIYNYRLRYDDFRIRSSFLMHTTTSGRLSSREPNLQNIPRNSKVRQIFQPEKDHCFIEIDYSQAELRVAAFLSNDEFLRNIYLNNKDLHTEMTIELFGSNFTSEERVFAKTVNFGILYGLTAIGLHKQTGRPIEECQEMINGWFDRVPRLKEFIDKCRRVPLVGGSLRTPFGRYRRFNSIGSEDVYSLQNEASNFPIQSIASDLTLLSAMSINDDIKEFNGKVVNLVHDSILMEVPDTPYIRDKIISISSIIMKQVPRTKLQCNIPFEVEAKVGYAWGLLQEVY